MTVFAIEKYAEVIQEIIPLFVDHYKEIANNQEEVPLDPDFERYQVLENQDVLHIVTARSDEGELIGYMISFISNHIHYKGTKFAENDILYVHPDHRGTTVAYRMFKFCEKDLVSKGVEIIQMHMKTDKSFEPLTEKLGYKKVETLHRKYVGG